ncbi:hypothetical protein ACWGI9_19850 [Streptomyces sp. NPDC054833]
MSLIRLLRVSVSVMTWSSRERPTLRTVVRAIWLIADDTSWME